MAVLNIRNLPEDVHARLRQRAARAGRSMEAEARAILTEVVCGPEAPAAGPDDLQAWVDALYGGRRPAGVVDNLLADRRAEAAQEATREAEGAP